MPNIKSAIKRVEVTKKKTAQRATKKTALKTTIKKCKEDIASSAEKNQASLKNAIKALDKAAAKNLIHKNAAARKISRLTKAYTAAQSNG